MPVTTRSASSSLLATRADFATPAGRRTTTCGWSCSTPAAPTATGPTPSTARPVCSRTSATTANRARNCTTPAGAVTRSCAPALTGCTAARAGREKIPPFLLFDKASHAGGRDVRFLGLAVPGAVDVQPTDDLVAIWRTSNGERFQNYRATFTILDVAIVSRAWLDELAAGQHARRRPAPGPTATG